MRTRVFIAVKRPRFSWTRIKGKSNVQGGGGNGSATGAPFTLSATVRNAGDGASAATTLRYYRSTDRTITTLDTSVGTDAVGGLAASATSSESILVSCGHLRQAELCRPTGDGQRGLLTSPRHRGATVHCSRRSASWPWAAQTMAY